MSTELAKINNASVSRQEFGVQQLEVIRETASTAIAAREKATVEARYVMALQRPRNIEKTRQELLRACSYPDFAKAAWFNLKQHSKGEGFTIRFAEEALRAFGNVYPEMSIVYESDDTRIIRITVTDMEANVPYSGEIVVKKRIEKSNIKAGDVVIAERINSQNKKVFLVEATDEEILKLTNSLKSRAIRTDGLRLIPAWLKEECKREIAKTNAGDVKKDPALAKRTILDAFAAMGVGVVPLEEYLGCKSELITEGQIIELRSLYTGIKEGDISFSEALAAKREAEEQKPPTHDEKNGSAAKAAKVAEEKLAEIRRETAGKGEAGLKPEVVTDGPLTEEQMRAEDAKQDQREEPKGATKGFNFGGKKQ